MEETPAVVAARAAGIGFDIVGTDRPNTAEESARLQGISLRQLLRSIVIRRGTDDYLFVLVPGDRVISWPKLRNLLGVSRLSMPDAAMAKDATGYARGTITPFGSTRPWPVIADERIRGRRITLGAGQHGVAVAVDANAAVAALAGEYADVTDTA